MHSHARTPRDLGMWVLLALPSSNLQVPTHVFPTTPGATEVRSVERHIQILARRTQEQHKKRLKEVRQR